MHIIHMIILSILSNLSSIPINPPSTSLFPKYMFALRSWGRQHEVLASLGKRKERALLSIKVDGWFWASNHFYYFFSNFIKTYPYEVFFYIYSALCYRTFWIYDFMFLLDRIPIQLPVTHCYIFSPEMWERL